MNRSRTIEITGLEQIPEVRPGDDLAALLATPLQAIGIQDGDVVAVTQKVVSKAEGRLVDDGDRAAVIAGETERVLAVRADLVITSTRHGFVCANAGVDASNVDAGTLSLLPEDPDASAAAIRASLAELIEARLAVVITDTFGRPWRRGVVNVAIGCAGLPAVVDLRGRTDHAGRLLEATEVALADEVAAASGLVMAKDAGVPAALLRGIDRLHASDRPAAELLRLADEDLFPSSPAYALRSMGRDGALMAGPVPRPVLMDAFAAAMDSPSPGEEPRWRFEVLESRASRLTVTEAVPTAGIGPVGRAGPLVVVPFVSFPRPAKQDEGTADVGEAAWMMSCGAAIASMRFSLQARGFSTRWTVGAEADRASLQQILGVSDPWAPLGTLACGPASTGIIPDPRDPASDDVVTWR